MRIRPSRTGKRCRVFRDLTILGEGWISQRRTGDTFIYSVYDFIREEDLSYCAWICSHRMRPEGDQCLGAYVSLCLAPAHIDSLSIRGRFSDLN